MKAAVRPSARSSLVVGGNVWIQQRLQSNEQCLEVAIAKSSTSGNLVPVANALDDLDEHRRSVEQWLGEDLQQATALIDIDENAQFLEHLHLFGSDVAFLDALLDLGQFVVSVGCIQKVDRKVLLTAQPPSSAVVSTRCCFFRSALG
jgi:hypothetical protein